ncbi:hypothetical protein [Qipengyuania oceanensis]|uniref:Uncharacterized protein n=1 Tax=Qipengyuania oceanensis TaxID=1463597 RepID=A0A844YAF4_9SPHN|nr:hypothetical protein [Qipengyuania oceanensis]MXO61490.1 hypothetical protein [Qipengyuania oceanensis]
MSRTTLTILMATVLLIMLAVIFELSFVARGGGVLLIAGLAYAYVVSKRHMERGEA